MLWGDLQFSRRARSEHIDALRHALEGLRAAPTVAADGSPAQRPTEPNSATGASFDHLYENLTILDNKANSLMAYVSILFSVSAFTTATSWEMASKSAWLLPSVISFALSALLMLVVIWVRWAKTAEINNPDDILDQLLVRRNLRTLGYRLAWIFALLGSACMVGHVMQLKPA